MVRFMKSINAAMVASILPKDLKITDPESLRGVVKTIAAETMTYYKGSATNYVDLEQPYWWWTTGALMGAMLDYSHYTQDRTYDHLISTALAAQVGPNFDFMSPAHVGQMGNDDLGFWGFAVLAAAERNLPQPASDAPSWLRMSENLWGSLVSRWDDSTCGGGLLWQIFPENPNGLTYKNSIANGALFQLSARLARATGNQTYADWAAKVYDWSTSIGLVGPEFQVVDGADKTDNCKTPNPVMFSYTTGVYMYGAAVMANHTGQPDWADRASRFLDASKIFFSPFDNATDVLYEPACERVGTCNVDMKTHKGQMARFLWASTALQPALRPRVEELLHPSATAAATTCTGGAAGTSCSHRWWLGRFDDDTGLGQEMCALETIQGILSTTAAPPLKGDEIKDMRFPKDSTPAAATEKTNSKRAVRARAARRRTVRIN